MGSLTLSIQYQKNLGTVFNSTELKTLFFSGVELRDQLGNPVPDETIDFAIESAQKEIQDLLSIKLKRMAYQEDRDFVHDDWIKWGYAPTTYPAVNALSVQGFLNTTLQIDYPTQWLKTKSQSPDEDLFHRSINLVPIAGASSQLAGNAVYVGISPYVGYFGSRMIPNYWRLKYITGFLKVPKDILNAIGKRASIDLFIALGDTILGVGTANKSISMDGLSQSLGTTASAMYSLFSARINQYEKDLTRSIPLLKSRYTGISFGVL